MCRNIHTLYNFEPSATNEEIRDASLQYVRKISGFTKPSQAKTEAFAREGDDVSFPQVGFTIGVLHPGQSGGRYHRESAQEDFLVLAGECLLLIEEEERPLKAWDFVHCPPGTNHSFVGAGDGPCVIFMTGARMENKETVYP